MVYFYFFFFKQKTAYEMRISDWSSDVCSSDLCPSVSSHREGRGPPPQGSAVPPIHCVNRLPRCPASRPLRGPVTWRSAHLPLSSPITATRRFSMSHHRLFAQLAFERALGMAALNALAQAVAECDQFRAVGRERDTIHFWVLAGELEDVVQDRILDVLDGPSLPVVERRDVFYTSRFLPLVLVTPSEPPAPS